MTRKFLITLATLFVVSGLTACNTIEGMGKDIGKAGSAIEDTAKKAK